MATRFRQPAGLRTGGALLVLLLGGPLVAQDGFRGWESIKDANFAFDPDQTQARTFAAHARPTARALLDQAAALVAAGEAPGAVRAFQSVIDGFGEAVVQVAADRWAGAAELARFRLLGLGSEFQVAYDALAEMHGRERLGAAIRSADEDQLAWVARRYANGHVGQEALWALTRMLNERGSRQLAALHARRLLDFLPSRRIEDDEVRARRRAQTIAFLALLEGPVPALRTAQEEPQEVTIAGQDQPLDRFLRELDWTEPVPVVDEWSTLGGSATRDQLLPARNTPVQLEPFFSLRTTHEPYESDYNPLVPGRQSQVHAIRLGELLLVNNSLGVKAINLYSRKVQWEHQGPMLEDVEGVFPIEIYFDQGYEQDQSPVSQGFLSGLSASQGVVLATLQTPEPSHRVNYLNQRTPINRPFPRRGMVALSEADGSLLWAQHGQVVHDDFRGRRLFEDSDLPGDSNGLVRRLNVPAPPVIIDDRVFALGHFVEGGVNSYLQVHDLHDGRVIDTVPLVIGQQELTMFNMPFKEFTSGVPSLGNGMIYCPTNLGVVAAVDVVFGDLKWLTAYSALDLMRAMSFSRNRPRAVFWCTGPPVDADGFLLVAPQDSQFLHAFQDTTGILRWQHLVRAPYRPYSDAPTAHFLGVHGSRAIVQYDGALRALSVEKGHPQWDRTFDPLEPSGRGCLSDGLIYVPTEDSLLVFGADGREQQVVRWPELDDDGEVESYRSYDRDGISGNVLVFPDMVLSANRSHVSVAFDPEELRRELLSQIAESGEDFSRLSRLGNLERQSGNLGPAIAYLERSLEHAANATPEDLLQVQNDLCHVHHEQGRARWDLGDPEAAVESLRSAWQYALDADTRLMVARTLLEELWQRAPVLTEEWLQRLGEAHGTVRTAFPEWDARDLPLEAYVGLELARIRELRRQPEAALHAYQSLYQAHAQELIQGQTLGEFSLAQITRILESEPPELRERYHADAQRSLEEAAEEGDLTRLAFLLQQYPNAEGLDRYTALYCDLLRQQSRPGEALEAAARTLGTGASVTASVATREQMLRAAVELDNGSLAREILERLEQAGVEVPDDLRAQVDRTRWVPQDQDRPRALPQEVQQIPVSTDTTILGSDFRFLGEPLREAIEGCLVLEDHDRLYPVEPGREAPRWETRLDLPSVPFAARFVHVSGVLVVRHLKDLFAIDLSTGDRLWTQHHGADLEWSDATGGVLVVMEPRPVRNPGQGADSVPHLKGVEPRSGRTLWVRALEGGDFLHFVTSGGYVITVTSHKPGSVRVFDVLSGRPIQEEDPEAWVNTSLRPVMLPDQDLLVVPQNMPTASRMSDTPFSVDRMAAYELGSNKPAWVVDLEPYDRYIESAFAMNDGLGLLVGRTSKRHLVTVDPQTGRVIQDQPLDPKLSLLRPGSQDGDASFLFGYERVSIIVRNTGRYVGYGADGKELWTTEVPLPDATVSMSPPVDAALVGPYLAVLVGDRRSADQSHTSDLLFLDRDQGEILEWTSFERPRSRGGSEGSLFLGRRHLYIKVQEVLHVLGW